MLSDHAAKTGNNRRRGVRIGIIVSGTVVLLLIILLTGIIYRRKVLRGDNSGNSIVLCIFYHFTSSFSIDSYALYKTKKIKLREQIHQLIQV